MIGSMDAHNIFGSVHDIKWMDSQYREYPCVSFDTETPEGVISLLTASTKDKDYIYDVTAENVLDTFIDFLMEETDHSTRKGGGYGHTVVFAHNLDFDFSVVFNQFLYTDEGRKEFGRDFGTWIYPSKWDDVYIDYSNNAPHFGTIQIRRRRFHLRDTFAFFGQVKLSSLGKKDVIDLNLHNIKDAVKDATYRKYAMQDARTTYDVGCQVLDWHRSSDIELSVSSPNMSMKKFRKDFLFKDVYLQQVPESDLHFWELSYHGGKSECIPGEYKNQNIYDINSSYPFAMTRIPSFVHGDYRRSDKNHIHDGRQGIYNIKGKVTSPYFPVYDHEFQHVKDGRKFNDIWITSYELETALKYKAIVLDRINASLTIKSDDSIHPLREWAHKFYKLKSETPKDDPYYMLWKVGYLNSLYGKFIQRNPDEETGREIRAKSYQPAIASLITGHGRAQLLAMQYDGGACHCATDSVFCKNELPTGKKLGDLSFEGNGKVNILRTKLYYFMDDEGKIFKDATHAFKGSVDKLRYMAEHNGYSGDEGCAHGEYLFERIPHSREWIKQHGRHKLWTMNTFKECCSVFIKNSALLPLTGEIEIS